MKGLSAVGGELAGTRAEIDAAKLSCELCRVGELIDVGNLTNDESAQTKMAMVHVADTRGWRTHEPSIANPESLNSPLR
jgi:hypothetical protein